MGYRVLPQSVKPISVSRRYLTSILKELDLVFGELRVDLRGQCSDDRTICQLANPKGATNATITRDLTALSRLMAACQAWGWRSDNPVKAFWRSVVLARTARIRPPQPPRENYDRVLSAVPEAMAKVLRLLDQTGMRENEAVALTARLTLTESVAQIMLIYETKTSQSADVGLGSTPGGDAREPALEAGARSHGTLFPSRSGKAYWQFCPARIGAVMRQFGGG